MASTGTATTIQPEMVSLNAADVADMAKTLQQVADDILVATAAPEDAVQELLLNILCELSYVRRTLESAAARAGETGRRAPRLRVVRRRER